MSAPLHEFLDDVPPVKHAFAYGSAVFHQPGLYTKSAAQPMADYFLVVEDAAAWHDENILRNPKHYGTLAYLGGSSLQCVACNVGAKVHFNTLVNWRDRVIKYGVIAKRDALQDLREWDQLYTAGRLHKPVRTLAADADVARAQSANVRAAVATALILLPSSFLTPPLHRALCGLSYRGDVRMTLAEDSQKVSRIAAGSADQLSKLYCPEQLGTEFAHVDLRVDAQGQWSRDASPSSTLALLASLPSAVLTQAVRRLGVSHDHWRREQLPNVPSSEDLSGTPAGVAASKAHGTHTTGDTQPGEPLWGLSPAVRSEMAEALYGTKDGHVALVAAALGALVARSSRWQAVAGLLANGPRKSCVYVGRKVIKSVSGWIAPSKP